MNNISKKIKLRLFRNNYSIGYKESVKNRVNLEWWNVKENVGDVISGVIYKWMLEQKNVDPDIPVKKTVHLMTVGSLIGMMPYDAVIWGSGIHTILTTNKIINNKNRVKFDIRAVRGPVTKHILNFCGYNCENCCMGDPAVIMPLIYTPEESEKKYKYSIIRHLKNNDEPQDSSAHYINVNTSDYKHFINEICASELVLSSSLHGIILAEVYGVPAVFVNENMDNELMKFYDWYFATGRQTVVIAESIEKALAVTPMKLPDLSEMRKNLIKNFPYDLFENVR